MSIQSVCRAVLILATASLTFPAMAHAGTVDEPIGVVVDQAKLVKMPDRIATIVVGNPMIADVTLQPGGQIIVTGKGYGSTNFIAMDRRGEVLADRMIQVEGPTGRIVTVYRGLERESYSCSPVCQRRVTLGDSESYFKSTMDQAGSLSNNATASSAARN